MTAITNLSYLAVKAKYVISPKPELILAHTTPNSISGILLARATIMKLPAAKLTTDNVRILCQKFWQLLIK